MLGVAVCMLTLVACTSMRPLASVEPGALRAQLEPGDEVAVMTHDGAHYEGTVQSLDEHALSVNRTDSPHVGERIEIPYERLATVSSRRAHVGRSVFASIGAGAVGLFVILSIAILIAFG